MLFTVFRYGTLALSILVCLWNSQVFARGNEKKKDGGEREDEEVKKEEQLPRLNWDDPIWCVNDRDGKKIRVQCYPGDNGVCLVAPGVQVDGTKLRRTQQCNWGRQEDFDNLRDHGIQIREAVAESQPGWYRDEKGRVFQITFDLFKRIYVGASWQPAFDLAEKEADLDRVRLELGLVASWLSPAHRNRHTIRALNGFVVLTDLEMRTLLLGYDLDHKSRTPIFRVTTFLGKPKRSDLTLDLGWGFRLLDLHIRPHRTKDLTELEFFDLHSNWDLWQSSDLYSHLRLETGLAMDGMWNHASDQAKYFFKPNASIKGRFGLDSDGFHYILSDIHWALPIEIDGNDVGSTHSRVGFSTSYEVIFLAINDQPLTFRVEAAVDYRDDLPPGQSMWEVSVIAGLRFSLWVPARLKEKLKD